MFQSVLIFLTFLSSSAQAAFELQHCPGKAASQVFNEIYIENLTQCDSIKEIQAVVVSLQDFFPVPIKDATLFLQNKSYNSHADLSRLIVLNTIQMGWGKARSIEQNRSIWAHELGHLEFNALLVNAFKPINGFVSYLNGNKKRAVAAKDPELNTWPELQSRFEPDFGKARDLQVPYSEMYADLVGTLNADDLLAMQKAMTSPGMPELNRTQTAYYAFAGDYTVSKWTEKEVHFYLAPTRAYIGKKLLHFPLTSAEKRKVLQTIFDACAAELNQLWTEGKTLPAPAEANRRLIDRISKLVH